MYPRLLCLKKNEMILDFFLILLTFVDGRKDQDSVLIVSTLFYKHPLSNKSIQS